MSKAGHNDKPMTTFVYDYPDGTTAKFYIKDVEGAAGFLDQWRYWYPNPPTGTPAFSVSGKYVYEHPASSTPRYYLG